VDAKTGEYVINVLKAKHPDAQIPDVFKLEDYKETPAFIDR
jgi:hypothetical protein